jgi:hypothetical protein
MRSRIDFGISWSGWHPTGSRGGARRPRTSPSDASATSLRRTRASRHGRVIRHTSYSLPRITPDDAALDMAMLRDEFHLFTDLATGQDSVLYRDAPATFRLSQLRPRRGVAPTTSLHLSYSELPAPRLTVEEAAERLDLSGVSFVFFENQQTGRGNLLYHRNDGDYGLTTPAD